MDQTKACLYILSCGSPKITSPVSLMVNNFDVRNALQEKVSLVYVNQMFVFHEALNGCDKHQPYDDDYTAVIHICIQDGVTHVVDDDEVIITTILTTFS